MVLVAIAYAKVVADIREKMESGTPPDMGTVILLASLMVAFNEEIEK